MSSSDKERELTPAQRTRNRRTSCLTVFVVFGVAAATAALALLTALEGR